MHTAILMALAVLAASYGVLLFLGIRRAEQERARVAPALVTGTATT